MPLTRRACVRVGALLDGRAGERPEAATPATRFPFPPRASFFFFLLVMYHTFFSLFLPFLLFLAYLSFSAFFPLLAPPVPLVYSFGAILPLVSLPFSFVSFYLDSPCAYFLFSFLSHFPLLFVIVFFFFFTSCIIFPMRGR